MPRPTTQTAAFDPASRPQLTGIFIPRAILEDARLSVLDKVLFGLLDGYARGERGCFASNSYLARVLVKSPRTIRDALMGLEKLGLVRRRFAAWHRTFPDGSTVPSELRQRTIATVSSLAIETAQGGRRKIAGGGGEKSPPYSKERLNTNPPNPPKGGRGRVRKVKLTAKDYESGF